MKANTLHVDPELEAQLGECKVGDTKQMLVTVEVTGKDDKGLTATITGVEPYEDTEPEYEEPTESPALKRAMMAE
jgi:hypothetical protein